VLITLDRATLAIPRNRHWPPHRAGKVWTRSLCRLSQKNCHIAIIGKRRPRKRAPGRHLAPHARSIARHITRDLGNANPMPLAPHVLELPPQRQKSSLVLSNSLGVAVATAYSTPPDSASVIIIQRSQNSPSFSTPSNTNIRSSWTPRNIPPCEHNRHWEDCPPIHAWPRYRPRSSFNLLAH
jgi:hypothetical protein